MTDRLDDHELLQHLKAQLRQAPSARVVVGLVETLEEGPPTVEQVSIISSDNFDDIGDAVAAADQLLRHAGTKLIARVADDWSRERIVKIEAARAVLNFEKRALDG